MGCLTWYIGLRTLSVVNRRVIEGFLADRLVRDETCNTSGARYRVHSPTILIPHLVLLIGRSAGAMATIRLARRQMLLYCSYSRADYSEVLVDSGRGHDRFGNNAVTTHVIRCASVIREDA